MLPALAAIVVIIFTAAAWCVRRAAEWSGRPPAKGTGGAAPAPPHASVHGGDAKQDRVYKDYPELRRVDYHDNPRASFESFCWPKAFAVQKQQLFAAEYMEMEAGSKPRELLVFHLIGAGKTGLSIRVALKYCKKKARPLFVMPASLEPGCRNELRGKIAGDAYLTDAERATLATLAPGGAEYRALIAKSDARIDADFQIYSYDRFTTEYKTIDAPIIIVDEVQNINNPEGVRFGAVRDWIDAHPASSVMLMSGTPIFDRVGEVDGLARLLRVEAPRDAAGNPRPIEPADIPRLFSGKVSYYAGAPPSTFPAATVSVRRVRMSRHQARWYHSEVKAEMLKSGNIRLRPAANNFYINSRQLSNIAFPKGLTGEAGLAALTPALIRESLRTYSAKFASAIRELRSGDLSFVYSCFTGPGGIAGFTKCLRAFGWRDFATAGPGRKRYAVWSGDESGREKDRIRAVFNSAKNDDASQIQVVIGSPSIKEGVSLLRVRKALVLEAYWNHSRLAQIYGRAVRYCSHKSLPRVERTVEIHIFAATAGRLADSGGTDGSTGTRKGYSPEYSVDLFMLDMADAKREAAEPYVAALIDIAVDKRLWYPAAGA